MGLTRVQKHYRGDSEIKEARKKQALGKYYREPVWKRGQVPVCPEEVSGQVDSVLAKADRERPLSLKVHEVAVFKGLGKSNKRKVTIPLRSTSLGGEDLFIAADANISDLAAWVQEVSAARASGTDVPQSLPEFFEGMYRLEY